jgi:hypothetical protein
MRAHSLCNREIFFSPASSIFRTRVTFVREIRLIVVAGAITVKGAHMLRPRVSILCSTCGGESFRGPQHPKPDDYVLCTSCGMQNRYGALEAESIARTKRVRGLREAGRFLKGR